MPAWLAMIHVTERTIAAALADRFCKSLSNFYIRILQKLAHHNLGVNEISK
jgi:hypothetical protein